MPARHIHSSGSNGYVEIHESVYTESAVAPSVTKYPIAVVSIQPGIDISTEDHGPSYAWRRQIANHDSATTTMTVSGVSLRCSTNGKVYQKWEDPSSLPTLKRELEAQGTLLYSSYEAMTGPPPSNGMDKVNNRALQQFFSKAIAAQRTFNGGTFLGELRETVHAIRHPLSALQDGIHAYFGTLNRRLSKNGRSIRRQKFGSRVSAVQSVVSNTYLEYAFGWKPLMSDVDDALKALVQYKTYREPTVVVHAGAKDESLDSEKSPWPLLAGYIYNTWETKYVMSVKYYGCIQVISGTNSEVVRRSIGLTLGDVVPTLWELIPYSFLVDYFTNIGAIVDAACFNTASVRWVNKGTYQSSKRRLTEQLYSSFPSPNGAELLKGYSFSPTSLCECERFSKSRTAVGVHLSIPSLEFRTPFSSDALDTKSRKGSSDRTHVLNIAALIGARSTTRKTITSIVGR